MHFPLSPSFPNEGVVGLSFPNVDCIYFCISYHYKRLATPPPRFLTRGSWSFVSKRKLYLIFRIFYRYKRLATPPPRFLTRCSWSFVSKRRLYLINCFSYRYKRLATNPLVRKRGGEGEFKSYRFQSMN